MYSLQPGLGLKCIWNRAFNDGKGRIQSGSLIFFVIEWVLSMRPDFHDVLSMLADVALADAAGHFALLVARVCRYPALKWRRRLQLRLHLRHPLSSNCARRMHFQVLDTCIYPFPNARGFLRIYPRTSSEHFTIPAQLDAALTSQSCCGSPIPQHLNHTLASHGRSCALNPNEKYYSVL